MPLNDLLPFYDHGLLPPGVYDLTHDEFELLFPSLFRRNRTGVREKGIVRIVHTEGTP